MKSGFLKTCRECQGQRFFKEEVLPKGKLRCSKCKNILEATTEFFHKSNRAKSGFKSSCKTCRSDKAKIYREKNRDEILERERQDRIENPEKFAKWSKKYYDKVKNTDEYKLKQRTWWDSYYGRHQVRLVERARERYEEDPAKGLQIVKKYQQSYKGQLSIKRNNHKRRIREKNSLMWFTPKDWKECIKHFNHKCCYCGEYEAKPTMEHFIPLSKGGEFSPKNILPSCLSCNSSKGASSFDEWYPRQDYYSSQREEKILKYLGYKKNKQQMAFF